MPETVAAQNGHSPDARHAAESDPVGSDRDAAVDDSLARVRAILVGPEQRELQQLQTLLLDPEKQTRDVSRVLPDALQLRAQDPQLMRALAPSIEDAITASVKRDPQPLADALFPVIGPAIRKAVAHTFEQMMQSVNQTVDQSVSWRALRWRVTAWQTGKPFSEIVLLNTLEFRVEQIFLIHRETGLLLQHLSVGGAADKDADQISGMLTAITDFARDSFNVGRTEGLESLRVGEFDVTIEQGPHALLAAVVRGTLPESMRPRFQATLESVHRQFGPELKAFSGDASPFTAARPILQECLVTQRRTGDARRATRRWATIAGLLAVGLGVWLFFTIRERQRFNAYVAELTAQPGIMVTSSGRRGGRFFVTGLRDAMAADPAAVLARTPLSTSQVEGRWEPYEALHPPFVAARAAALLRPPSTVSLSFAEGVLTASGTAPERWVAETARLAPALSGVRGFAFRGDTDEARLAARVQATAVGFARGSALIVDDERESVEQLATALAELHAMLDTSGRRARIEVLGQADSEGADDLNLELSRARAEAVVAALDATRFPRLDFETRGLGRAEATPGMTAADYERQRRVTLRVHLAGEPASRRSP